MSDTWTTSFLDETVKLDGALQLKPGDSENYDAARLN